MTSKIQVFVFAILVVLVASQANPYCSTFNTNHVCTACYAGYYINPSNICVVGSAYCKTFTNDGTGNCATCWYYTQYPPTCLTSNNNPWCATFSGPTTCISCYAGYYINIVGVCTLGNSYCKTFTNDGTGNCASCWDASHTGITCSVGYVTPVDLYCTSRSSTGLCLNCTVGYYVNYLGICTLSNQCPSSTVNSTSNNSLCSSCWVGYTLYNGICTISATTAVDPYCESFLYGVCTDCYLGFYFNSNHM